MKRRSLTTTLAASVALAAMMLTGCATSSAPSDDAGDTAATTEAIRMGTQPWIGYGPWYVAEEQGFFSDREIDVDISNFNTDADMNAALAAGRLDMGNVGSQAALQFIEQGLDLSIVLLLDSATTADAILSGEDVASIADLKGKTVAYEEGATSEILLSEALEAAGLTFDDITPVPTGADQVAPIVLAKQVDAGVTYEPYVTEAHSAGKGIKVLESAGDYPGIISDVLVVRNEVLADRPEEVRAVIQAWQDTMDFKVDNESDFRAIIAEGVGSNPEELVTAFDGVHFYTVEENATALNGEYLTDTLPRLSEIAIRIGLITEEVDPSATIDASFLGN